MATRAVVVCHAGRAVERIDGVAVAARVVAFGLRIVLPLVSGMAEANGSVGGRWPVSKLRMTVDKIVKRFLMASGALMVRKLGQFMMGAVVFLMADTACPLFFCFSWERTARDAVARRRRQKRLARAQGVGRQAMRRSRRRSQVGVTLEAEIGLSHLRC